MTEPETCTIRRLLVPLDGSRLAEAVLPAASAIAGRVGASLTLIHIREQNAPQTVHGEPHLRDTAQALAYLDRVADRLRGDVAQVEAHVHETLEGDVACSIVEHANEYAPDLVLLCAHGRSGLRDFISGSIAQQVLQQGAWPILLLQPLADGAAPAFSPKVVMLPVEDDEHHEPPIEIAVAIACAFGATLRIVVAVPTRATLPGHHASARRTLPATMSAILEIAEENAVKLAGETASRCRDSGATVEAEVVRGEPVAELLDAASRRNADLIVMSSHGRAGLDALVSGSVGARLMAKAGRPILLVKEHAA